MSGVNNNPEWKYAEPDLEAARRLPILTGFEGIRVGDHLIAKEADGWRIARVVSNIPAGRDNGIIELRSVWRENPKGATKSGRPIQWVNLRSNAPRFFSPEPKPIPKPEPKPIASTTATRPPTVTQGQPGTLAALNCIHSAVLEGTKKTEEIAKQTYTNVGEIADLQADTNRLLQELLNEIKGLRAIWEGK